MSASFGALAWGAGLRPPGTALAHSVAERLICAVRLTEDCRDEPALRAAHGAELAALLRAYAPTLLYEEGMTALPVDFRRCRSDDCARGTGTGTVSRSESGEPTVIFTHVIDCREGKAGDTIAHGTDCSGSRAGNLYLQYWLYYPGSATAEGSTPLRGPIRRISAAVGRSSFHPDDWEGYQVRIGPAGTFARATSHHTYNGWEPEGGGYYISGGSHAGRPVPRAIGPEFWRRARRATLGARSTKDHRLHLVPIETLAGRGSYDFAVTPPWRKRVYFDPESSGTE